jgi:hypothetical protein
MFTEDPVMSSFGEFDPMRPPASNFASPVGSVWHGLDVTAVQITSEPVNVVP